MLKAKFLCIAIICLYESLVQAQCDQPPSVITSLPSLECSILSNEFNIQSLTEAFFPANRRPAFIVEVYYYINRTEHPLDPEAETVEQADYVYFWFSSPVLAFVEPRLLSGLSLNVLSLEYHYAHITIAPLISDNEDWIRGRLTNATIWLKSYAERRISTLVDGIETSSQGFSAYKPNLDGDDYFLHNATGIYEYYVIFLGLSLFFIVTITIILVPKLLYHNYQRFYTWTLQKKTEEQAFRFRNFLWGSVSVLGFFNLGSFIYELYHVVTFGLQWKTRYSFIYPLLITGALLIFAFAVAAVIAIIKKANDEDILIEIPRLFYILACQTKNSKRWSFRKATLIVWQGIGVWIVVVSSVSISFFLCGILLALFVDTVEVITNIAIYLSVALCGILTFSAVYEMTDKVHSDNRSKCVAYLNFGFKLIVFILIILFIGIFGFTYATIVFFSGGDDELGIFSSVGELIPILLVPAIGWILKKELGKYYYEDDKENEENNLQLIEAPMKLKSDDKENEENNLQLMEAAMIIDTTDVTLSDKATTQL